MPNHCGNRLTVEGNQSEVRRFKEYARGNGIKWKQSELEKQLRAVDSSLVEEEKSSEELLDLNKFVPIDPILAEQNTYSDFGYSWCINHWGTKWGCYSTVVYSEYFSEDEVQDNNDSYYILDFNTAWNCFSESVFQAMVDKFPELKITVLYYEPGMSYCGRYRYIPGQGIHNEHRQFANDEVEREVLAFLTYRSNGISFG